MVCTCALNDILRACFAKCSLCVAQTSEFSHPPTPPKSVGWQVVSHARRLKTGTMRPTYRRLPMLAAKQGLCCRMFLLLHSCASMSWTALCFDVRGAHKLFKVREDEQGFSCFVLDGKWYCYRSCYFGCRWAAYWFSRLGGLLVRLLHQFVRIPHGLLLYVDDGILLVPTSVAPLVAATCLMLLCGLGVPLSWDKLKLSQKLSWIGWKFKLDSFIAVLPDDKAERCAKMLRPLVRSGVKMLRKDLERLLGLLLWFTCGAVWMRPWLQTFYSLLHKPLTL